MTARSTLRTLLQSSALALALGACELPSDDPEECGGESAAGKDCEPAGERPSPDASKPDASKPDAAVVPDAGKPDAGGQAGGTSCSDQIAPTTANVEVLLQRSCALAAACHTGASPQAGLSLGTLDDVLATAVGKPSTQAPTLSLIAPGEPDDSYLLRKIRDMQTVGTAMPPGALLCDAKAKAIEGWIRAGAKR